MLAQSPPPLQHLLSLQDLNQADFQRIFERAALFADDPAKANHQISIAKKKYTNLKGRSVFNLFFEPSTRTLTTFAIAATRLSADVHSLNIATSSQNKGESILDTVSNLMAMGADYFVIRHPQSGAAQFVADYVGNRVHVVNAGDGRHAHPTQGLLDLFTLRHFRGDSKGEISHLSVVIVGDILHSRVARSQIWGLKTLGVQDIRVVGPATLLPEGIHEWGVKVFHDFDLAINGVDAILMLRLQNERMERNLVPSFREYFHYYGLDEMRLKRAHPKALVLHPGPINRGVEIDSSVADGTQSVILAQVSLGIAIRMAVLSLMVES